MWTRSQKDSTYNMPSKTLVHAYQGTTTQFLPVHLAIKSVNRRIHNSLARKHSFGEAHMAKDRIHYIRLTLSMRSGLVFVQDIWIIWRGAPHEQTPHPSRAMITLLPVTEGSKKAVDYCLFAGRTRFYWNEEEHPNAGVCCYQTNFTSHNQNIRGKAIHTQLGKTKGYKEKDGLKWDSPPRNTSDCVHISQSSIPGALICPLRDSFDITSLYFVGWRMVES
ncbi:hypothetical protein C8J57DRAFT_1251252 [Mycena rebaudengoi]|nr:hypothetical protein C8J57DRAFT_1251252 [Mycena rebaudengoi]